jgi:magnesium-transporting ATPase (P-type)
VPERHEFPAPGEKPRPGNGAAGPDEPARDLAPSDRRKAARRRVFRFDPRIKLMTTVDQQDGGLVVKAKGAPQEVPARAATIRRGIVAVRDRLVYPLPPTPVAPGPYF